MDSYVDRALVADLYNVSPVAASAVSSACVGIGAVRISLSL